ncbi:NADPH-dependent F420 reductase [Pseudomonas nunensis]|uniref:NADPH-dependent F420 reductase n=1 Tax=Pseudomonas nunensis TaxID=2961896 RepID=UPI0025B25706|nr:NADPH-dependent F420 reductase [Pseudomonas nunensis]MDN3221454.1 NADPH-dependent F420 reductase [Pseudomonas nunensis]
MSMFLRSVVFALAAFWALLLCPVTANAAEKLRIAVIGAGSHGGTIGQLWVKAGHEVMFSSRNLSELDAMVKRLGPLASVGTPQQAAKFATVVFFAVPYDALPKLGRDLAPALRGKIVLDATNPPPDEGNPLSREAYANGVGETSAKYLPGTRLVRAFSATDATSINASSRRDGEKLGVPIASNDPQALQVAAQLVRDVGSEPVITGNLATARTFQRGGAGFRANTDAAALRQLLNLPPDA